jgi:hypothetical protein
MSLNSFYKYTNPLYIPISTLFMNHYFHLILLDMLILTMREKTTKKVKFNLEGGRFSNKHLFTKYLQSCSVCSRCHSKSL